MRVLITCTLLLLGSSTSAARERGERRISAPPLRIATGATVRQGVQVGAVTEIGFPVVQRDGLTADVGFVVEPMRRLFVLGPARMMGGLAVQGDALVPVGPWLRVGPAGSLVYRQFRQQGQPIDQVWVPAVGGKLTTTVLQARTWRFSVDLRGTTDLAVTQMVLETAQIVALHPLEAQIALRFHTGLARGRRRDT